MSSTIATILIVELQIILFSCRIQFKKISIWFIKWAFSSFGKKSNNIQDFMSTSPCSLALNECDKHPSPERPTAAAARGCRALGMSCPSCDGLHVCNTPDSKDLLWKKECKWSLTSILYLVHAEIILGYIG